MYIARAIDLPSDDIGREFAGAVHGSVGISLILVDATPGGGPALHRHAYDEVAVVQEGRARWVVDGRTLDVGPGDVVVVHAGEAHRFVNTGDGPLRQLDVHLSPRFATEWLDARDDGGGRA